MPKRTDINKIMIIGSGPIIIGQACEFDYSGTQACKALRQLGYEIVLVNSNPATIMTDPDVADITYIEPLNLERLTQKRSAPMLCFLIWAVSRVLTSAPSWIRQVFSKSIMFRSSVFRSMLSSVVRTVSSSRTL